MVDLFGKFLTSLPDTGVQLGSGASAGKNAPLGSGSVTIQGFPQAPRPGATVPPTALQRYLLALSHGPKSVKDLLSAGDDFTVVIAAIEQLQSLGYAQRSMADQFELTQSGREIAQMISAPPVQQAAG